jgi:CheY-like chemotaxis protein
MRQDRLLKDRAIVAVTANTRRADREELLEAGFTGYIPKPVVLRTLRQQLSELAAAQPEALL